MGCCVPLYARSFCVGLDLVTEGLGWVLCDMHTSDLMVFALWVKGLRSTYSDANGFSHQNLTVNASNANHMHCFKTGYRRPLPVTLGFKSGHLVSDTNTVNMIESRQVHTICNVISAPP